MQVCDVDPGAGGEGGGRQGWEACEEGWDGFRELARVEGAFVGVVELGGRGGCGGLGGGG